jgi:hypothetical protein
MQDEDEFIQTLTIYKSGFESVTWKIISGLEIRTTRGKYFSVGKVSVNNKVEEKQVSSEKIQPG